METNMIPLVDGYYFSCDDYNYVLYLRGTRKKIDIKTKKPTGEMIEFTDVVGFYSDLLSLVKGCVRYCNRDKIRSGQLTTLQECVKDMNEMYSKIEKLVGEH